MEIDDIDDNDIDDKNLIIDDVYESITENIL